MVLSPTISKAGGVGRLTLETGNEVEVGQGIKDSGIPRSQIFVTSKLWNTHQPNVAEGLQKTLDDLSLDYLDLYVRGACSLNRALTLTLLNSSSTGRSDLYQYMFPYQSCLSTFADVAP